MRAALTLLLFCGGCYDLDALSRNFDGGAGAPDLRAIVNEDLSTIGDLGAGILDGSKDAAQPRWQPVKSPTAAALHALALDGSTLYAVGTSSTILRIDAAGAVSSESAPPGFTLRAAAAAGGSIWAVGDDGTVLQRGTSGWSYSTVSDGTYYAAFALGAADLFVAGTGGGLYRGQAFEDSSTLSTLYGLWGASATELFAVGAGGVVVERTGDPPWSAITSGTSQDLFAVFGQGAGSAGELLAVGAGGTILHSSDGQSWTAETSGTSADLFAVWLSGDVAFAVGEGGTVLRRSAGVWRTQLAGGAALRAVLGRAADDVWAVGDGGAILHYAP